MEIKLLFQTVYFKCINWIIGSKKKKKKFNSRQMLGPLMQLITILFIAHEEVKNIG